jgi:hypothetical protein
MKHDLTGTYSNQKPVYTLLIATLYKRDSHADQLPQLQP